MRLTDTVCKGSKPSQKPRKLSDGAGLYLEIMPSGGKSWRLKYRFDGKENRLSLGMYPLVSLKMAREKRDEAKALLDKGINPSIARQEQNLQRKISNANTFEAIAKEWLENKSQEWSAEYCKTIETRLEKDLFPKIGSMPIKSISAPILLDALRSIESRGVYETTKRSRQYAGQIFRYAVATGRAERDPSNDIKDALKTKRVEHFKAMDIRDLPEFMERVNTNEARLYKQTCLALKLMVLTFTRKTELSHAKWEEINFKDDVWIIPAERMKMKKEHIVPLSKQSVEILRELEKMNTGRDYVFVSQISSKKPMNADTILRALYSLGYKGEATIHGFRAMAMTAIMEQLGYRREIPDRQLAHSKGNSVMAAYDRAEFLKERKKMMQDWADYIDKIVWEAANKIHKLTA